VYVLCVWLLAANNLYIKRIWWQWWAGLLVYDIILTLSSIKRHKLCLHVYKATVRQTASYLSGMLTAVTDVTPRSTLRDASNGDYVVPRTRLKFGERAFSVAAPSPFSPLLRLRNDLYCIGWGVKLYSLTRPIPPSMELAANWTEVDAFHASLQAFLENVLVPDCLGLLYS